MTNVRLRFGLLQKTATRMIIGNNTPELPDQLQVGGWTPQGFQQFWHKVLAPDVEATLAYTTHPEDQMPVQMPDIPGPAGRTRTPFSVEVATSKAVADRAQALVEAEIGRFFDVIPRVPKQ